MIRTLLLGMMLVAPLAVADYGQPGTLAVTKSAGSVTVGGSPFAIDAYTPNTGGPWPVIGLGHGFSNSKDNMVALAQLLATRGNVVVVPQFPVGSGDHARNGQALLAAMDWAISTFPAKADASRQGVAGHSAGGLAAFLAAAARPALKAAVMLDAVDSNGVGAAATVTVPTLLTFATPGSCNTMTNSTAWYAGLGGPKGRLVVVGAGHCDAQDPTNTLFCTLTCGAANAARQTLFKRYAVAWLQYFVSCEAAAREAMDGTQTATDTTAGGIGSVQHAGIPAACSPGTDAGFPTDAGSTTDAGVIADAGMPSDGGTTADAGKPPTDGGTNDAGSPDAGSPDAGISDAGTTDAGVVTDGGTDPTPTPGGCGCTAGIPGISVWLLLLAVARRRRQCSRSL